MAAARSEGLLQLGARRIVIANLPHFLLLTSAVWRLVGKLALIQVGKRSTHMRYRSDSGSGPIFFL